MPSTLASLCVTCEEPTASVQGRRNSKLRALSSPCREGPSPISACRELTSGTSCFLQPPCPVPQRSSPARQLSLCVGLSGEPVTSGHGSAVRTHLCTVPAARGHAEGTPDDALASASKALALSPALEPGNPATEPHPVPVAAGVYESTWAPAADLTATPAGDRFRKLRFTPKRGVFRSPCGSGE